MSSTHSHSATADAWQEVMPDRPFLPMDSLILCSLMGRIFRPFFSAVSQAIEVTADLQAIAKAELSGMN